MDQRYYDVQVLSSHPGQLPVALTGAILYGSEAESLRQRLATDQARVFHCAAVLHELVARNDKRFPAGDPRVIDLQLAQGDLSESVRVRPEEWRGLCEACAERTWIKLHVAAGGSAVAGARKLTQAFPKNRFLVDGFRHGWHPGWQAHVRLAEFENVWLTTVGMLPNAGSGWQPAELAEAIHFTLGEVGAGKLLYGSGLGLDQLSGHDPVRWLEEVSILNDAERELILLGNWLELC